MTVEPAGEEPKRDTALDIEEKKKKKVIISNLDIIMSNLDIYKYSGLNQIASVRNERSSDQYSYVILLATCELGKSFATFII